LKNHVVNKKYMFRENMKKDALIKKTRILIEEIYMFF